MRAIRTLLFGAVLAGLVSCGGGSGSHALTSPTCAPLPAGHFPHVVGTLSNVDRSTYCLRVGDVVQVALRGTLSQRWTTVTSTSSALTGTQPIGVLTPRRDITLAFFKAAHRGQGTLQSTFGQQTWSATIVVR